MKWEYDNVLFCGYDFKTFLLQLLEEELVTRALSKAASVVRCGEEHGRKDQRDHGHHGFGGHMGSKGFEPLAKHNAKNTTEECWGGFSMINMAWHMLNVYAVSLQHVSKNMLSVTKSNSQHGTAQLVFSSPILDDGTTRIGRSKKHPVDVGCWNMWRFHHEGLGKTSFQIP